MALKKVHVFAIIALVVVAVALSVVTAGLLASGSSESPGGSGGGVGANGSNGTNSSERVGLGGNVVSTVNVGVYNDADATVVCSNVDWGNLSPGSTAVRAVYVKNTGDVSETLSIAATGWNPSSAGSALTFGWNKEGTVLPAGAVVPTTLTLTVSPNTGDLSVFGFNIVVSGSAA